ncbi:TPA: FAD-dependent oxidoreductase, partial [Burkholderia vietnamiensis]|nr:FAD-dependent oxidoreductase [Burkholderia vietnamiensis]HEP6287970.1 FAD-dependent oxidoreductase [Burkholderia vietnamiensis]HEP6312889.1 FAD-dependent oxidoreductase [Burkholderia vietnamiensis]
MSLIEVKVPDIGDFSGVDVIEVNIKPGDVIGKEQTLLTLESDKASMEVPSDIAGTVKEIKVKAGDKVSQGTVIALVEASAGAAAPAPAKAPEPAKPVAAAAPAAAPAQAAAASAPAPQAGSYGGSVDIECDMLVLGAGPGGYSAAFRAADLGMKTVLVERYSTLGGVCLNVGCIPSKALLHTALVVEEAAALASHGITFGKPQVDLDKLRDFKGGVVKKLTTGLAGMAKARKVEVVTGIGAFLDAFHMEVQGDNGKK